ncbi:diacylglycerol/lipid kinase family protein [Actinomyces succiniciruminis]|uniref:Diacylglycerol kinase n=1 Tax=Actinomyces succiniciruminis TaxID=1522002 RepID=A0A1L7RLI5_9ACTO|nr:diacylglycerol kinase family protein [Actinomyces succiniciruminis]CED90462.1 Diacylglycerol kinase [Actinomyces succiniciruminis]
MTAGTAPAPVAAVVINPAKPAATSEVRRVLGEALRAAGYRTVWLETSARETGAIQARLAVASGARLVVAAGGDGTVRTVAAGLAGTGVDMGIMPLGTANLAARNLGLPLRRYTELARIAASGRATPTDLMWVRTEAGGHTGPLLTHGGADTRGPDGGPDARIGTAPGAGRADAGGHAAGIAEPPQGWARPTLGGEHACLVVAGIGFDAGLVASTRPALKERLSWGAYGLAALENLGQRRLNLVLRIASGPASAAAPEAHAAAPASPQAPRTERMLARTLLIANGGRLPAGVTLLPDARLDDGLLDVAAIDTLYGLWGWASLARQVLPPRPASYSTGGAAQVLLRRGREVTVWLERPAAVEVDGDLVAPTRGVRVRVQPGALRVRRPA